MHHQTLCARISSSSLRPVTTTDAAATVAMKIQQQQQQPSWISLLSQETIFLHPNSSLFSSSLQHTYLLGGRIHNFSTTTISTTASTKAQEEESDSNHETRELWSTRKDDDDDDSFSIPTTTTTGGEEVTTTVANNKNDDMEEEEEEKEDRTEKIRQSCWIRVTNMPVTATLLDMKDALQYALEQRLQIIMLDHPNARMPDNDDDDWMKSAHLLLSTRHRPIGYNVQLSQPEFAQALLISSSSKQKGNKKNRERNHDNDDTSWLPPPPYCSGKELVVEEIRSTNVGGGTTTTTSTLEPCVYDDACVRIEGFPVPQTTVQDVRHLFRHFTMVGPVEALENEFAPPTPTFGNNKKSHSRRSRPLSCFVVRLASPAEARQAVRTLQGSTSLEKRYSVHSSQQQHGRQRRRRQPGITVSQYPQQK